MTRVSFMEQNKNIQLHSYAGYNLDLRTAVNTITSFV